MAGVSQKCQYALRAVFELAKRQGDTPVTTVEIASAQAIPQKFLEVILGQLKQAGFVESRRGVGGGYLLAVSPRELAAGEVIRFIDGPIAPVRCVAGGPEKDKCPLKGTCAFISMWEQARDAVAEVYDTTTFQDLIAQERTVLERRAPTYSI